MHRRPTLGASGCRRRRWSGETASRRSAPRGPRVDDSPAATRSPPSSPTTPDVEPHLDPPALDRHPHRAGLPACAHGLGGRPSACVYPPRRGTRPGAPLVCRRARQRRRPGPSTRRSTSCRVSRVRWSCSSWLMASGMESSHRGFASTVEVLSAKGAAGPPSGGGDGFAREASAGTSDRPGRRACGRARGRWSFRLEVGAGGGGSGPGSRHPPLRRRRARPRVASTAPAPTSGPPGAAAEAGVPGVLPDRGCRTVRPSEGRRKLGAESAARSGTRVPKLTDAPLSDPTISDARERRRPTGRTSRRWSPTCRWAASARSSPWKPCGWPAPIWNDIG